MPSFRAEPSDHISRAYKESHLEGHNAVEYPVRAAAAFGRTIPHAPVNKLLKEEKRCCRKSI